MLKRRAGWLAKAFWLGVLFGVGGSAFAAGYERVEVPASASGPAIQAMAWSPCASPPASAQLGFYDVQGTPGCAVHGDSLSLVVVSHGRVEASWATHDTATALADAGFVVVSFNHPGDMFGDDSAAHQVGIFESRPRKALTVRPGIGA